jgi:hypothetical protein
VCTATTSRSFAFLLSLKTLTTQLQPQLQNSTIPTLANTYIKPDSSRGRALSLFMSEWKCTSEERTPATRDTPRSLHPRRYLIIHKLQDVFLCQ